jgi:hypothetical protein
MDNEKKESTKASIHGKYFDTVEEMVEYADIWPTLPANIEFFKSFLETRLEELEINLMMNPDMTNEEAFELLRICMGGNGKYV